MKKVLNIIIIILISIFIFNIDVNAEEISCSYEDQNGNNVITIKIDGSNMTAYYTNSLGSGQPFFPMNFVYKLNDNYWFDDNAGLTGNYVYGDRYVAACPKLITNYYKNSTQFSTDIKVEYINAVGFMTGHSSPMSMPIIFFSNDATTKDNQQATLEMSNWHKYIEKSEFSSYNKIEFKLDESKEIETEISEDGTISCNYKSSGKSGLYNFKFKVNGDPSHEYSYNSGTYNKIIFDGEGRITSCPSVIKIGNSSMQRFTKSSPDACYYDDELCFYEESVSPYYGNNGTLITYYVEYTNTKHNKASVFVDVSGNLTFNNGEDFSLENASNFQEIFLNNQAKEYPRYIFKLKSSSNYVFANSIKDENGNNYETSEVYVNINYLGPSGTGLSNGDDGITTCTLLFEDTFLELLDKYVFKVIWIGVPIILILLTTFDFAKVVFSDEKDGMSNAFTRLWKRTIAAVLIFLTPYIIIWIANLIDPTQTTVQSCAKKIRQMGNTSYIVK